MSYVFEPEARAAVPVAGSDQSFPVRRVYCVGRNYAAHAREMGFSDRELPFFFCKNPDNLVPVAPGSTGRVAYPSLTQDYQHEIELVVAIGKTGKNISVDRALEHVWGYGVGLDMTRRDLQIASREKGRPWEVGKAFDQSAPIAPLHAAAKIGHPTRAAIWLQVDGVDKQRSNIDHLTWSVPEVIANLSTLFELRPGDLIFTGTPEGVSKVVAGQTMQGGIDGLGELQVQVV